MEQGKEQGKGISEIISAGSSSVSTSVIARRLSAVIRRSRRDKERT